MSFKTLALKTLEPSSVGEIKTAMQLSLIKCVKGRGLVGCTSYYLLTLDVSGGIDKKGIKRIKSDNKFG